MKTKSNSTPPLTPKSTSSTPTTIESETPVTTPYTSITSSSKPRVEDLLEIISIQDNKIDKLTKRVTKLVQMLREAQSCNLIATNTSKLSKIEVDKLKQYSRRSCLVISGVELPPNKSTESAEETEKKVCRIIETNLDISREDFDYELDKVHRLPPNKKSSDKKKQHASLRISYVNLEQTVSQNIFSQGRRILLISLIKKLISMLDS